MLDSSLDDADGLNNPWQMLPVRIRWCETTAHVSLTVIDSKKHVYNSVFVAVKSHSILTNESGSV